MNIGDVARKAGLPPKTIRYYEDIGLIKPLRDTNGYRRTRQNRHHFPHAAAASALSARELHTMGRIKHNRRTGFTHDGEAAHVRDQIVVAEAGTTLTGHEVVFR